jgi:hypothetical protein
MRGALLVEQHEIVDALAGLHGRGVAGPKQGTGEDEGRKSWEHRIPGA